jgi:hypothetical protein
VPEVLLIGTFDLPANREEEVLAWHTTEHLPERLGVDGFISGKRLLNISPDGPRFLIVYELAGPDVMTSAGYLERLNNPTPWTRRSLQAFQHGTRTMATVLARFGTGGGDLIALFEAPRHSQVPRSLGIDIRDGRVTWGVSDLERSSTATEEGALSGNRPLTNDLVLVESRDQEALGDITYRLVDAVPALVAKGQFAVQSSLAASRPSMAPGTAKSIRRPSCNSRQGGSLK